jgi:hypothetical protein
VPGCNIKMIRCDETVGWEDSEQEG